MKGQTNAEKAARFIAKHGKDSLDINEIPGTSLWMIGEKKTSHKWKVYVCDPSASNHRLITNTLIEEADYAKLWIKLVAIPLTTTKIKHVVEEYKKAVTQFYKTTQHKKQ
jgi:hypothetical protein